VRVLRAWYSACARAWIVSLLSMRAVLSGQSRVATAV
jgi:hypothetical protein